MGRTYTHAWLAFCTPEERAIVDSADAARAKWHGLAAERRAIQNRAIQRMIYAGKLAKQQAPDLLGPAFPPKIKIADFIRRAKP